MPSSLSDLQEAIARLNVIGPIDSVLWMSAGTFELVRHNIPPLAGRPKPFLQGLEIFIDRQVPYRVIESGSWVREDKFEEGAKGVRKLVRRCYQI